MSPAHLAADDSNGKWKLFPHLRLVNNLLVRAWTTPNSRTAINIPFQHGKSWMGSIYFPAWVLLNWPATRIALASYEEGYACIFGGKVRDIVEKYGPELGIRIRSDSRAKGEWVIDGHGGGMVCKGRGGALVGRPADLLILDDLIKNAIEAQSPTILDGIWDWYNTVAYSRLGPTAPVIGIGTRWGPKDIFGRWIEEAKAGGDTFDFINLAAIAESDDPLGRPVGAALCPERVPLARLKRIQSKQPRWFRPCWQGKPVEGEGLHFQPRTWPRYHDVGDAWRIHSGVHWLHYRKADCTFVVPVDWAQSGKKKSNKTAIVVSALTPDGKALVLSVFSDQLRYEDNAPALAKTCANIREGMIPLWVQAGVDGIIIPASDDDMLSDAMLLDCRRQVDRGGRRVIPEIRLLGIRGKSKIIRAQAAITRSQNGLFYMPDKPEQFDWYESTCDQLSSFTGEEGAEDDVADCFGILGRIADQFKPGDRGDEYESVTESGYVSQDVHLDGMRGRDGSERFHSGGY